MTIDKEIRAEILRLYYAEKWKIGTIARQLGVHHITVDRVLADAGVPRQDRRRRSSKLDPFMPFIRHTLAVYPTLTASRLYDMVYERGYPERAAVALAEPGAADPARVASSRGAGPELYKPRELVIRTAGYRSGQSDDRDPSRRIRVGLP